MTNTTTDAAEARAREVLARAMASKHWGSLVREGKDDNWGVIKPSEAIRAMIAFATAEAASGAGEREASDRLGAWLSAALDDPKVCDAMKADIEAWFGDGKPAAPLPPATDPAMGQRYQHVKRGTVYEVVGEAKVQDAGDRGIVEGDVVVVYRGDDGQLWAREYSEFHDGRFAALAAAPTIPATGERDAIDLGESQWNRIVNAAAGSFVRVPVAAFADAARAWSWILRIVPRTDAVAEQAEVLEVIFAPPTDVADIATSLAATIPASGHAATEGEGA